MNNIMSKDVILGVEDREGEYEESHLKEGKEIEITIKAKFESSDNLNLIFVTDSSNIVINIDDIVYIE